MASLLSTDNPFASETAPPLPGDTGARNRWYDNTPMAFNAIGWMLSFSPSIQHTLCGYLVPIIELYKKQRQETEWLKSMGSEKVLSLYQAQQKRRDCDQRQETFKMLSKIKTLGDSDRDAVVHHLHLIISGIRLYHGVCFEMSMTPRTADIRSLIETYRQEGHASMMSALGELKGKFESRQPSPPSSPEKSSPAAPTGTIGMRSRDRS